MLRPTDLMRTSVLVLAVTLCSSVAACDGGDSKPKAKAADAQASEADERKKAVEAARKKREAKTKAKEEEEAKKKAAVEAVLVLPEKLPKKLDKACKAAGDAQDAFMNRMFEGEAVEKWNAAKSTQMQKTVADCIKQGSIEVAACQTNALTTAPKDLAKQLPELLRGCIDKFGTKKDGATPPA